MFKRVLISVLAALQMTSYAAAYSLDDGQFYYRYKAGFAAESAGPGQQTKDITAYYIGGVGRAFTEKLPMKPQWEDDNWKITKGSLPKGISFNAAKLTFEGTPENLVSDAAVELNGFDNSGRSVASAIAYFTTYELPDQVVDIDIYNHTGTYGSFPLKLPNGLVIDGDPKLLSPVPPGVSFNARYFDGVPTKAGTYPVLAFGYDFLGKAVVAFTGHYVVEDAPTFAKIEDDVHPLREWDYYGCWQSSECVVWDKKPAPKTLHALKDASKVRYLVEVKSGDTLPGSLQFFDGPFNLKMSGRTYEAYDQATIRYKAIDTDGSVGYSNWFRIGSQGLSAVCQPNYRANEKSVFLRGYVGLDFNGTGYKIPTGLDTSSKTFTITDGSLPNGLSLDAQGIISGKPAAWGDRKGVTIRIDYPGVEGAEPTVCGPYDFQILPDLTNLDVVNLKEHYRVGEALDVELKPTGAVINPWTVSLADGATLPTGIHYDEATHHLSGTVNQTGNFSANFIFKNGDAVEYPRAISFIGHGPLDIHDVAETLAVKKFDKATPLVSFSYDAATPIGPGSETFSLVGGPLPEGLTFNSYDLTISGGTRLPENRYGPFKVRLTDATGQSDETKDFFIDVTPREGLVEGETVDPLVFYQNLKDNGQQPFSVTQPALAQGYLPLTYSLLPSALPTGLAFNEATGKISGKATATGETDGYRLKISETGPDNLQKTSEPFAIVVEAAPPVSDVDLPALEGNKDGPLVTSASPAPALAAISDKLVDGAASVVFDGVDPSVSWLSFDSQYGTLSGTPSGEYQGAIAINYHDGANRPGKLNLPVTIYPYPQLKAISANVALPRLSQAADYDIGVEPANSGFYKGAVYQLAPSSAKLPAGLTLSDGRIVGTTSAAVGTTSNLIIRAVSKANGIVVDYPLVLSITAELPMKLDILPDEKLVFKIDEKTGQLSTRAWFTNPKPSGSFVGPIRWSLKDQPSWMTIGADGQIYGNPTGLGQWTVNVVATDAENHAAEDAVTVKVTLSGDPVVTELNGAPANGDTNTVRVGESFRTTAKLVVNAVKPWRYVDQGRPDTLSLDPATGVYAGRIEQDGTAKWSLKVEDADERQSVNPVGYTVVAVPPLSMPPALSVQDGKQYDPARPIFVQFQPAKNKMGKITYGLTGDLPGSLYYKLYDNDNPTELATYLHQAANGQLTSIRQQQGMSAAAFEQAYLQPDHLVFDTLALTLKGIPSASGTYSISLVASDDHQDKGYSVNSADPTRVSNNVAQSASATFTVAVADDLQIANSAASEALSQYTSASTLTTTVLNDAYGKGISWRPVSGTVPPGLNPVNGRAKLTYGGYATSQGSWTGITWEGTDATGRKIVSDPVAFTVGPRKALALKASPKSPRPIIVFDQDADLTVTADNVANGLPIGQNDWTVSGANKLPPGVTYDIANGSVHFHGTSDVIGVYSGITVTARDAIGATASIALTFNVISSPDAIVLNTFNIKTKPGYPVEMQPPFATAALSTANTYGDVRFYSNDLPNIAGLNLDQKTGFLTGTLANPTKVTFDLFVTDDTNRVTSKPVTAEVLPYLRLIVPSVVTVEQGTTANEAISTDYVLGKVAYAKGQGTWPSGVTVNPDTGAISGTPTGATGNYTGLTIIGTDVFGNFKDIQSSNAFTIHVDPINASPVISAIPGNRMVFGTQGTAATPFTPIVKDSVAGKPWNYAGTVYSLNRTLPAGLSFDSSTGTISGTPSEPIIIRDLKIKVTAANGDSSETPPFWFGVAPKGPIVPTAGQTISYKAIVGSTFASNAPLFDNVIGNLSYAMVQSVGRGAFNTSSGVFTHPGPLQTDIGNWPITVIVTDEFNRTGTLALTLKVVPPPTSTLRLTVYGSTDQHVCMGYVQLLVGGVDVFPGATLTSSVYGFGTHPDNLKDPSLVQGGNGKDGGLLCWQYVTDAWLDITVPGDGMLPSGDIKLYQRDDIWGYGAIFTDVGLSRKNEDGTFTPLVRRNIPDAKPGQIVTLQF